MSRYVDVYKTSYIEMIDNVIEEIESKAIPVTGRGCLYHCEILRIALCLDSRVTDDGEVVSLTRRQRSTPQKLFPLSGIHFC
jgi:hypothetical protein